MCVSTGDYREPSIKTRWYLCLFLFVSIGDDREPSIKTRCDLCLEHK